MRNGTVKIYSLRRGGCFLGALFFGCMKKRPWYLVFNAEKIRFGHVRYDGEGATIHCLVCIPLLFGWCFSHGGKKFCGLGFA